VDPFPYKPPQTADERKTFKYTLPATIGESLDPKLVDAYVQQWNVNIQQEVVKQIVLSASYVGSKGTHQPMLRELNPAIFGPGATLANVDARRIYAPSLVSISDYESIGASSYPSRVVPGMRMGGHMGHEQVTVRNLEVIDVDTEDNVLAVKGAVPGPNGGYVLVRRAKR